MSENERLCITCKRCAKTSHNPSDVINRYCGYCRQFLPDGEYVLAPYQPLNPTNKALITYYAFIALCDDIANGIFPAVLAQVEQQPDVPKKSRLLQMIYAAKAIDYLKQDGLL